MYIHKVHKFWEGHKILRNLHLRFELYYIGQIYGGDFAKLCGHLRIYELYILTFSYEILYGRYFIALLSGTLWNISSILGVLNYILRALST